MCAQYRIAGLHTPCPHPAPGPWFQPLSWPLGVVGQPSSSGAPCWLFPTPGSPSHSFLTHLWPVVFSFLSVWGWFQAPLSPDLGRGRPHCPPGPGTGSLAGYQRRSVWPSPQLRCWRRRVAKGQGCVCACECRGGSREGWALPRSQARGPLPAWPLLAVPGTWILASLRLLPSLFTPIDSTASWSLSQSRLPAPFSLLETVEFNSCC